MTPPSPWGTRTRSTSCMRELYVRLRLPLSIRLTCVAMVVLKELKTKQQRQKRKRNTILGWESYICGGGFVDCESGTIWSLILLGKPAAFVGHGPTEQKRESTQSRRSRADVCRCLLCTQLPPSAVGHLCVPQKKPEETCERNISASRGRTDRSGVGGANREHWIPSPPPYSTSG